MAGGNVNIGAVSGQSAVRDPGATALRPNRESAVVVEQPGTQARVAPPATEQGTSRDEAQVVEEFSADQLRDIANAFGEAVGLINKGVRVEIDESSKQIITQIVDRDTDEVIRQIPPEELLEVSRRLKAFVGTLLDLEI